MKKIFIPLFLVAAVLVLSGCFNQETTLQNANDGRKTEQPETNIYSFDEISQHNSETDCWLLISGQVYNVTEFIAKHPGGKAILKGCGQEATQLYSTRPMGSGTDHSEKAYTELETYYIGNLKSNNN